MPAVHFRDAGPMVDDTECSIASQRNGDLRTSWCTPDRVFYKVTRDFGERFLRCQHHDWVALDVQRQGDALLGGKMSQRLGRPAHDDGCIQAFHPASIGALQPCEAQELTD